MNTLKLVTPDYKAPVKKRRKNLGDQLKEALERVIELKDDLENERQRADEAVDELEEFRREVDYDYYHKDSDDVINSDQSEILDLQDDLRELRERIALGVAGAQEEFNNKLEQLLDIIP